MDESHTDRSFAETNDSIRTLNGVAGDSLQRPVAGAPDLYEELEAGELATKRESTDGDTSETKTASSGDEQMNDEAELDEQINSGKVKIRQAHEAVEEMQVEYNQFKQFERTSNRTADFALYEQKPNWPDDSFELVESFEELNLSPQLFQNIRSAYIDKPNDVQRIILPFLLANPDQTVYVKSRPHSCKKTSYLINIIQRIDPNLQATQAVVIAPVAELVYYIAESAKDLAQQMNICVLPTTQQDPKPVQTIREHLIVTTLGTWLYLAGKRLMELSEVRCFVFDEVDLLMTTPKNIDNMRSIYDRMRRIAGCDFQLSFFSTSFCDKPLHLIKGFGLKNLRCCMVLKKSFPSDFLQFNAYSSHESHKERKLISILQKMIKNRIVLYSNGGARAERLAHLLEVSGFRTILLTSLSTIPQRLLAIHRFNSSKVLTVLCLTYPVAHGISLDAVNVVINFDLPQDGDFLPVEYMHRISKCNTAVEKPAFVYNLVDKKQRNKVDRIKNYFRTEMVDLDRID